MIYDPERGLILVTVVPERTDRVQNDAYLFDFVLQQSKWQKIVPVISIPTLALILMVQSSVRGQWELRGNCPQTGPSGMRGMCHLTEGQ